jgi:hypothetical protein
LAHCKALEAQYYHQEHVLHIPGWLQLDDKFIAEENILVNIQKKAPLTSERVTRDNVMVQESNVLSEWAEETAVQVTQMGQLTFDLNLQLENDEHNHLSAADDQANLM